MKPPRHIAKLLDDAAAKHGVEPALLRAIACVESSFDPNAVSPVGAKGLLQLMDQTAAGLGVKNAFDPAQNANGGAKHLAWLLKRFSGHVDEALAAYNWGHTRVERRDRPWPESVRRYVDKVKARAVLERASLPSPNAPPAPLRCAMCGRDFVENVEKTGGVPARARALTVVSDDDNSKEPNT